MEGRQGGGRRDEQSRQVLGTETVLRLRRPGGRDRAWNRFLETECDGDECSRVRADIRKRDRIVVLRRFDDSTPTADRYRRDDDVGRITGTRCRVGPVGDGSEADDSARPAGEIGRPASILLYSVVTTRHRRATDSSHHLPSVHRETCTCRPHDGRAVSCRERE